MTQTSTAPAAPLTATDRARLIRTLTRVATQIHALPEGSPLRAEQVDRAARIQAQLGC